jgi:hypothetical protein
MASYRCVTECFAAVPIGSGLKHILFKVGDVWEFPEGAPIPRHFVPVDEYREGTEPRLQNETKFGDAINKFPPVRAPEVEIPRRGRPRKVG